MFGKSHKGEEKVTQTYTQSDAIKIPGVEGLWRRNPEGDWQEISGGVKLPKQIHLDTIESVVKLWVEDEVIQTIVPLDKHTLTPTERMEVYKSLRNRFQELGQHQASLKAEEFLGHAFYRDVHVNSEPLNKFDHYVSSSHLKPTFSGRAKALLDFKKKEERNAKARERRAAKKSFEAGKADGKKR
jgi:hypothetical protein